MSGTLSIGLDIGVRSAGWSFQSPAFRSPQAYSAAGKFVTDEASKFGQRLSVPFSTKNQRLYAIRPHVEELYLEHRENGWDGEQAPALALVTIYRALAMLKDLPSDIPDPEFSVEPDDGSLVLEWWGGYRRIVSIAISREKRFSYIAMNGVDESHGVFLCDNGTVPYHVLQLIRETMGIRLPEAA